MSLPSIIFRLPKLIKAVEGAKTRDETGLALQEKQDLGRRYDDIVSNGLAFHEKQPAFEPVKQGKRGKPKRRIAHNLLLHLQGFKAETLRFMADFAVSFTNNQAERHISPLKTHMIISDCFGSMQGAKNFAILKSISSKLSAIHRLSRFRGECGFMVLGSYKITKKEAARPHKKLLLN